jgi:hypothetical protein
VSAPTAVSTALIAVFASAATVLVFHLLTGLDIHWLYQRARSSTRRPGELDPERAELGPGPAPGGAGQSDSALALTEQQRSPCGCLTLTGALALLHAEGYLPLGNLASGGELLAAGEAAVAVWPQPPHRIAAVQFGTLTLGPEQDEPSSHLGPAALLAAARSHRDRLATRPAASEGPARRAPMFEPVAPLSAPPPAQQGSGHSLRCGDAATSLPAVAADQSALVRQCGVWSCTAPAEVGEWGNDLCQRCGAALLDRG